WPAALSPDAGLRHVGLVGRDPRGAARQQQAGIRAQSRRPAVDAKGPTRRWNTVTGKPHGGPLRHHERIDAVAFSDDGQLAATGSADHTVQLWDTATAKPVGNPLRHSGPVRSVAFGRAGKTILTTAGDTAWLWDTARGLPLQEPF